MFNKFFIGLFIFINLVITLHADEKKLIINRLIEIDNITFDFEQITNNKRELGICVLVFDNKLNCNYEDSKQKEIIMDAKRKKLQNTQSRIDAMFARAQKQRDAV